MEEIWLAGLDSEREKERNVPREKFTISWHERLREIKIEIYWKETLMHILLDCLSVISKHFRLL